MAVKPYFRKFVSLSLIMLMTLLLVGFQNCERHKPATQMSGNGSGYTGVRPPAGDYVTKVEGIKCATQAEVYLETITVKEGVNTALVQNECEQTSKEVPVSELNVQPYRSEHVTRDGRIYELKMSREVEYVNEALCDFSDQSFAILVRWYNVYLFHVAHIFTMDQGPIQPFPLIRYSDYDFGNGNFGTGYLGTDFQLAVLNNYKVSENALAGFYNGKVGTRTVEALGVCVTTTYVCESVDLTVKATSVANTYEVKSSVGNAGASTVAGTLSFTGAVEDLGNLSLVVQRGTGPTYDCSGYVSKMNNELSVGGCKDRPTIGQSPKNVMVQVRGQIKWTSNSEGVVNSKVCYDKSLAP